MPPGHKCGRLHGHGFEVIVHANQDIGTADLGLDYDQLDALWAPLHFELNYRCLNELQGLENPTSERLALWIWQRLKPDLPALSRIVIHETCTSGCSYSGE